MFECLKSRDWSASMVKRQFQYGGSGVEEKGEEDTPRREENSGVDHPTDPRGCTYRLDKGNAARGPLKV